MYMYIHIHVHSLSFKLTDTVEGPNETKTDLCGILSTCMYKHSCVCTYTCTCTYMYTWMVVGSRGNQFFLLFRASSVVLPCLSQHLLK